MAEESDRRIMTMLYAQYKDDLLRLSTPAVLNTPKGKKVATKALQEAVNKAYPERFAPTTSLSAAQNIASSGSRQDTLKAKSVASGCP